MGPVSHNYLRFLALKNQLTADFLQVSSYQTSLRIVDVPGKHLWSSQKSALLSGKEKQWESRWALTLPCSHSEKGVINYWFQRHHCCHLQCYQYFYHPQKSLLGQTITKWCYGIEIFRWCLNPFCNAGKSLPIPSHKLETFRDWRVRGADLHGLKWKVFQAEDNVAI